MKCFSTRREKAFFKGDLETVGQRSLESGCNELVRQNLVFGWDQPATVL